MSHRAVKKRIEDAIDPLVDAISQLVLAAATNSLDQVKSSCEDIAKYTQEVVEIAKDDAIASNDVDVQIDITKAINDIASTIENLVITFNNLFTNPNKDTQRAFAKGAKDTGDAINALLIAADNTYLRKITEAVNSADNAANSLKRDAPRSKEALVKAAQASAEQTVKLVKVATKAADATIDQNKGNLLRDAAEQVKALGPALIQSAKGLNASPNDSSVQRHVEQQYNDLRNAYDRLVEYAKMTANYVAKVSEAWENAQRLLELARQMEDAANALKRAALHGSKEDFLAAAKRAAQVALDLIKAAEAAAALEKDPVKKKMILSAIEELRQASSNLLNAAREVHADPHNPEKQRKLEDAHRQLSDAIAKVMALTDPNSGPATRFYYTAQFLEDTAGKVVDEGKKAEKPKLVDDAQVLAATALHFVKETQELASTILDPDTRNKLLTIAGEVKDQAHDLIKQANKVADDPSNQKEVVELDRQYNALKDKLDDARVAAGFAVTRPRAGKPPVKVEEVQKSNIDFMKGENELVTAAKQQAVEALKIAEQAEKFAREQVTDPKKKQEILDAAKELRDIAHRVIKAAEAVAANPNDERLQKELVETQKDLSKAVAKVIGLTSEMEEEMQRALRELEALLAESEQLFQEFFAACKACQADVEAKFLNVSGRRNPKEMVDSAKKLSEHANNIAKILREMSAKSNDPRFRQQLDAAGKYVRDRAIQVKMISAVKVAMTGDEVDDNQVVSAAKGLHTEVADIVKAVRAGMLKRRLQSTQAQTLAMKKIRELWAAHQKKFMS
jgi:hypothetical protein